MFRFLPVFFIFFFLACHSGQKAPQRINVAPPQKKTSAPAPATETIAGSSAVVWLDSERLMPVLEQAQREKKPVFVEFYASWCAPCKVMEEEIFTQKDTYRYLNSNFLNFRTDLDSPAGKTIASIYEVKSLPTVLFLNPQGVVLERHVGIANPSVLRLLGDSALGKLKQ